MKHEVEKEVDYVQSESVLRHTYRFDENGNLESHSGREDNEFAKLALVSRIFATLEYHANGRIKNIVQVGLERVKGTNASEILRNLEFLSRDRSISNEDLQDRQVVWVEPSGEKWFVSNEWGNPKVPEEGLSSQIIASSIFSVPGQIVVQSGNSGGTELQNSMDFNFRGGLVLNGSASLSMSEGINFPATGMASVLGLDFARGTEILHPITSEASSLSVNLGNLEKVNPVMGSVQAARQASTSEVLDSQTTVSFCYGIAAATFAAFLYSSPRLWLLMASIVMGFHAALWLFSEAVTTRRGTFAKSGMYAAGLVLILETMWLVASAIGIE